MEKMFNWGAARVMTPKAMLTTSKAVIAGNTSNNEAPSTQLRRPTNSQK